jgi:hypothetical protein
MKSAREQLGRYPEDLQYKVLQGNARKLFDFTPAEPPAAHPR